MVNTVHMIPISNHFVSSIILLALSIYLLESQYTEDRKDLVVPGTQNYHWDILRTHSVVFVISEEKNDGLHPGLPVFNLEIPFHIMTSYDQKEMQGIVSRADRVMFEIFMIMFPGWTSWSGIEVAELLRNHLPLCSVNLFHVAPFQCPVG